MTILLRFLNRLGGVTVATPTLGTAARLEQDNASDVTTGWTVQYTSTTGIFVVFFTNRHSNAGTRTVSSVTFDGAALTEIGQSSLTGTSRLLTYAGWISGATTGSAKDLIVTMSGGQMRDFCGFAVDVSRVASPAIGASLITTGNTSLGQSATPITGAITQQNTLSTLLAFVTQGIGGARANFTPQGSWTELNEAATGSGATDTDISGELCTWVPGSTGSKTFNSGAVANNDDWTLSLVELLP